MAFIEFLINEVLDVKPLVSLIIKDYAISLTNKTKTDLVLVSIKYRYKTARTFIYKKYASSLNNTIINPDCS